MRNDALLKKRFHWNFWIPGMLFLLFLIIERKATGTFYTSWVYGLALILVGIMYSIRYKMFQPVLIFSLAGIALWHYWLAEDFETNIYMLHLLGVHVHIDTAINPFSFLTWIINMIMLIVVGLLYSSIVEKSIRYEHSARRIFETASRTVFGSENGFTTRPFSAGQAEYDKDEITGFARYLEGKTIAMPLFTENNIYLTFSMGKSPMVIHDPDEISYMAFSSDGKISVHVSDGDYRKYVRKLTFDQLCQSLSNNFKRYLNNYINNQESRILTELNN